jgi:hypothetical protein
LNDCDLKIQKSQRKLPGSINPKDSLLKAKKTGNSIRKTKSKAGPQQSEVKGNTLNASPKASFELSPKQDEVVEAKEPSEISKGPVKQEFIVAPYDPEEKNPSGDKVDQSMVDDSSKVDHPEH